MNKQAYKWLTVTLLLSVCVFCFLYLTKTLKTDGGQAVAEQDNSITDPATPAEPSFSDNEPVPEIKPIYYSTLPRTSQAVDEVLVQNVGGTSDDIFKSVHTVNGNYVVFFETSSNGHDVKSDTPCAAAALLDSDLTLIKTVTLSSGEAETFSAVKQNPDGFVLVTRAESYSAVYKLDFNLITVCTRKSATANGFSLYVGGQGLFLISELSDRLQISLLSNSLLPLKTATVFINGARVTDVFPMGNALNIFADTDEGYALFRYTEDGGFLSVNEVTGNDLLSVLPYSDKGALKFVGLRKNKTGISIFTANADFGIINEIETQYKNFVELFAANGNFAVYGTKVDGASISVYCKHLDFIIENDAPPFTSIPYRSYAQKGNVVGFADDTLSLCSFDGFTFSVTDTYLGTDGHCGILYDGTIALSSTYKSGVYLSNFGSNDVFLIKKPTD